MRGSAAGPLGLALAAALLGAGCAARGFTPPTGPGSADRTLAEAYQASLGRCAELRSITADLGLSGRVDGRRVRGTLQVGLTRDGGVRVEAVAPFGAPIFTIAGRADAGTLWLPRSKEVVRGAPSEILTALTGVTLPPAGLFEIVTACPADGTVAVAERYASADLARATLPGGAEVWWRAGAGPAAPIAFRREGTLAEYQGFSGGRPHKIRLRAAAESATPARADLTLTVKQLDPNVALGDDAFRVDVPSDARVLAVSELRLAGVLGR